MKARVVVCLALFVAAVSAAALAQQRSGTVKIDLKEMKATVARLEDPVFLAAEQLPLAGVLDLIEKSAGEKFVWDTDALPDQAITILADKEPKAEVLQRVLDQCNWTFSVQPDGRIHLRPVPKKAGPPGEKK